MRDRALNLPLSSEELERLEAAASTYEAPGSRRCCASWSDARPTGFRPPRASLTPSCRATGGPHRTRARAAGRRTLTGRTAWRPDGRARKRHGSPQARQTQEPPGGLPVLQTAQGERRALSANALSGQRIDAARRTIYAPWPWAGRSPLSLSQTRSKQDQRHRGRWSRHPRPVPSTHVAKSLADAGACLFTRRAPREAALHRGDGYAFHVPSASGSKTTSNVALTGLTRLHEYVAATCHLGGLSRIPGRAHPGSPRGAVALEAVVRAAGDTRRAVRPEALAQRKWGRVGGRSSGARPRAATVGERALAVEHLPAAAGQRQKQPDAHEERAYPRPPPRQLTSERNVVVVPCRSTRSLEVPAGILAPVVVDWRVAPVAAP